jgi:stearoyl-CoA desaturase (delta-9 desaturase)
MAAHGHRWWEIDLTFWAIRALQACGLAWDVVDYKRGTEKLAKNSSRRQRTKKSAVAAK